MAQPYKKYNLNGVRATIWKNQNAEGKVFYSFNFEKNYKDASGDWKNTQSFNLWDLPNLATIVSHLAKDAVNEIKPKSDSADMDINIDDDVPF